MRPDPSEYAPYYAGYVDLVPETDILPILDSQAREVESFWRSIPENAASEVHAPYTWSIRQVLDHLVDGERIFGYRLLRISRGDSTPLSGFDEHLYAEASEENPAPLADIIDSFAGLRRANYLLIKIYRLPLGNAVVQPISRVFPCEPWPTFSWDTFATTIRSCANASPSDDRLCEGRGNIPRGNDPR